MVQITPTIPPARFSPPVIVGGSRELGPGATGHDVKEWQDALIELGYLTVMQVALAPGVFGPASEAATKRFQTEHSVAVSGHVGTMSRGAMHRARAELQQFKQHTLERGMKNEAVRVLMRDLVALGLLKQETYDANPAVFGSATEAAVIKFQREHGLEVSGKAGVATRTTLASVLASRTPNTSRLPPVRHISQSISAIPGSYAGPAVVTMIAKAFGKLTGASDSAAINWLAVKARIGETGAGWPGVQSMARIAGLTASEPMLGADLEWVDRQFAAGRLVAASSGGRWIVLCGRAPDGDYLVQDPATDCRRLSPSQLTSYFTSSVGSGVGIAIS
jgi:peptidoglycan hydrolase-like protein with peptidoglycan-binding domain